MSEIKWPYANEFGQEEHIESDVLVLGGGIAGCFAALSAARRGERVVLVEKGATVRSGAAGTGFDHWESACTNPCSKVTSKEMGLHFFLGDGFFAREIDRNLIRVKK